MEKANQKCSNCWHYNAYYVKRFCQFEKQTSGYCAKKEKILVKDELCEFWRKRTPRVEKRKQAALRKLNDVLDSIIAIKQILLEAQEESKTQL